MPTNRCTRAVAGLAIAALLVACESESDGPPAQPAEQRDAPVTTGGQTPHVGDPSPDIGPPVGAAEADTADALQPTDDE